MLIKNNLKRVFLFKMKDKEVRLADPAPTMSAEQVLNFYCNQYSVLTIAKIKGPEIVDDEVQYRFVSTLGTKG